MRTRISGGGRLSTLSRSGRLWVTPPDATGDDALGGLAVGGTDIFYSFGYTWDIRIPYLLIGRVEPRAVFE